MKKSQICRKSIKNLKFSELNLKFSELNFRLNLLIICKLSLKPEEKPQKNIFFNKKLLY